MAPLGEKKMRMNLPYRSAMPPGSDLTYKTTRVVVPRRLSVTECLEHRVGLKNLLLQQPHFSLNSLSVDFKRIPTFEAGRPRQTGRRYL